MMIIRVLMMTKMTTVIVISRNPCPLNTSLVWRQTRQIPQTNSRLSHIGRLFLSPSMQWAEQGKYIQPRSNSKNSFGKVTNHPFLNQAGNNKLISIRLEWLLISYLSNRDLTLLKKWTWVWEVKGSSRLTRELIAYRSQPILKMCNKDSNSSIVPNLNSYSK